LPRIRAECSVLFMSASGAVEEVTGRN